MIKFINSPFVISKYNLQYCQRLCKYQFLRRSLKYCLQQVKLNVFFNHIKIFTMKKVSNYKIKISANRTYKADLFSLSGLQNYANRCFTGTHKNKDFINFCKDLGLTKADMKFAHVLKYGTEKELNRKNKETGKYDIKKDKFSFWLFMTCLKRYADDKAKNEYITKVEKSAKVIIQEKKTNKTNKKKIDKVA